MRSKAVPCAAPSFRGAPVYGTRPERLVTLALLRWYRAFATSQHLTANDPFTPGQWFTRREVPWHLKRLSDAAINRKAGVPDCPDTRFAICPLNHRGAPMRRARGDAQRLLKLLARRVNVRGWRVYVTELGEWGPYLTRRIPARFVRLGEE